ncbi:hypothetical protein [Domibacillus robiginosus]|uniref:hypothetical protein n=1 Tax=Domibacillus robiginosus TaxID=1071054 RepID=UPI000AF842B3|nr:hypothetical protein [Domibacillus robiginosus]
MNIQGRESISGQMLKKAAKCIELLKVREKQIQLNIQQIKTLVPVTFKGKL